MEDTYKGQVDNPLSLNRYTYVENNPLRFIDPSGHRPLEYAEYSSDRVNSAMLGFENAALYWAKETVKWADATGEVPYDVVHEVVPSEYVEEVKTIVGWVGAAKWSREAGDMPGLGLEAPGAVAIATSLKNTGKSATAKYQSVVSQVSNANSNWKRMTNKQATEAAKKHGYEPTGQYAKNKEMIFYNKKTKSYISQDIGSGDGSGPHNGGVWKMSKTIDGINRKETRLGTYNANLDRIGD